MNVMFTEKLDHMIMTAKGHEFELKHVFLPAGDHWELSYKGVDQGWFDTKEHATARLRELIMGAMEEEAPANLPWLTSVQVFGLENIGWEFMQIRADESAWLKFDQDQNILAHGGDDTWKRDLASVDLVKDAIEEEAPPPGAGGGTLTSVQITNLQNMGWEFLQVGPDESAWMKFDPAGKHVAHGGDDTWKRDVVDSRAAGSTSFSFSPFSLVVLDDPRFVGLWTYRPHGRPREFSASVMIDGQVQETEMHVSWAGALREAGAILKEETVP